MKIAAAYDNGEVCQDFAQTKQFKLYTIEDDHISHMAFLIPFQMVDTTDATF